MGIKKWTVLSLILLGLSWRLAAPIDLTSIDLGRHIKNGELILRGTWDVLYKNYYSYTCPDYPFINHHWFFGVFCYTAWHFFGFTGLSVLFIIIRLAAFLIFFKLAERFSSFPIACAFSLLSFPLVASRVDIRPEVFSTLFCGLFWLLSGSYIKGKLSFGRLRAWLIALQIIWVNTHIFFIMGPILTAVFWLQAKMENNNQGSKDFKQLFWLMLGACLLNPSGLNGALLPLGLFQGFHFSLVENLPVFASINVISQSLWRSYIISLELLLVSWVFLLQYQEIKKNVSGILLVLFLGVSSLFANRLITLYGHFWIPLISLAVAGWMWNWPAVVKKNMTILLVAVGILAALTVDMDWRLRPAFGLARGANDSARFFKQNRLKGPIFNNYDIGGYLIFHMSPSQKLFVDNRAEAFPKDFFDRILIPAQQDNKSWRKLDGQYHFNVIFLRLNWSSDYEESFILKRLMDPDWAVVFLDDKVVILLRRNGQNSDLIRRYERDGARLKKRLAAVL